MKIDRIELTRGGYVEFDDPADMPSKAYREVQGCISDPGEKLGVIAATALPILARELISRWEVSYLPEGGRMLPRSAPQLLDLLKTQETREIDAALMPVLSRMMMSKGSLLDADDPKAPSAPSPASD